MARTLQIRKPTPRQIERLEAVLESENDAQVLRRVKVLLHYADGLQGTEIAAALGVHPNTIYADLHAFDDTALACLEPLSHGGTPSRLSLHQVSEIVRVAQAAPQEFGCLEARWTLANLRAFLIRQSHLVSTISREHLRRILKKTTFVSAPCGVNWSAMIHSGKRF
jgi:transposase